ncbi:hypothetical protein TorRG33x02_274160 [Trema orientale]|uniref:Transmembrane protein n=1 Tax=Trema orientale TaxID=63057 RepID=A0A2P5CSP4_TREOI|nr:hypothetical protein TorRG33x02_274160 [Trema orientale]
MSCATCLLLTGMFVPGYGLIKRESTHLALRFDLFLSFLSFTYFKNRNCSNQVNVYLWIV